MKALDRKLLRDLYHAKALLLAITSIITVGVMCYVTLRSAYENLSDAQSRYYGQCRMADFWLELKRAPVAEIEPLAELAGVAQLDARIQFFATVDLEGAIEPINGLVLSMPDRRRPVLNDIVLKSGDYFSSRRSNEVIINHAFAEARGVFPGQTIHLLLNDRRQEVYVVGTATSSEFTYMLGPGALMPDPESFGVFYLPESYAEEVFDFDGAANQVVGRLVPGSEQNVDQILDRMEARLAPYGVITTYPLQRQPSHQFLDSEIQGLNSFATVIPAIFLIVAALVLNVLVSRLVRQQRTMIGTIKALGYRDRTVFIHFLKLGLIVGVAGALAGSVCGYALSSAMTSIYRQYYDFPDLRSDFHWYTHTVGWVASISCSMLGSLMAAREAVRLQPAEAMRPPPPKQGGTVWLEEIEFLWGRLGSAWRMTLRGVMRNRLRSSMAVFSSMMGAGMLMSGFMMYQAQMYLIEFEFHRTNRSDLELSFSDEQSHDAVDEVKRLPGVDWVEPVFSLSCTLVNGPYSEKIGIQGLTISARLTRPIDVSGEPIVLPDAGLVLGRRLAENLHVRPGDVLQLRPSQGERRPVEVVVARIVDGYIGMVAYAPIDYLRQLVGETEATTSVQILTTNDPDQERLLYRRLKEMPGIQSITDRRDLIAQLNEALLEGQWIMIVSIISFAGVIFLGSIVNSSMINLAERQREVATLRALGYSEWGIGGVFLRESMTTSLFGALLGLPVGYGLMVLVTIAFNSDFFRLPLVAPSWALPVSIGLAVVFSLMAHAIVQHSIFRMNYLDALNIKE